MSSLISCDVPSFNAPASSRSVSIFDAVAPLALLFPDAAVIEEAPPFLATMYKGPRATLLDSAAVWAKSPSLSRGADYVRSGLPSWTRSVG